MPWAAREPRHRPGRDAAGVELRARDGPCARRHPHRRRCPASLLPVLLLLGLAAPIGYDIVGYALSVRQDTSIMYWYYAAITALAVVVAVGGRMWRAAPGPRA